MTGICRENSPGERTTSRRRAGRRRRLRRGSSVGVGNGRDEREQQTDSGVTSLAGYENVGGRRAAARFYPESILRSSPVLGRESSLFSSRSPSKAVFSFVSTRSARKMKGSNQVT